MLTTTAATASVELDNRDTPSPDLASRPDLAAVGDPETRRGNSGHGIDGDGDEESSTGRCCGGRWHRLMGNEFFGLGVLTAVAAFNYLDRYIPSATKDLIKEDLGLSDFQTGFLFSAFIIVYMLTAPIFGVLADRGVSRKGILAGCIMMWSLSTAATSLAQDYWSLLMARACVGIGEGGFVAVVPSIICDYFPPNKVSRSLTVYYSVQPIGGALGYLIGGVLGAIIGWRWTFVASSLPGIVAILILLLREPKKGRFEEKQVEPPGLWEGTKILLRSSAYVISTIGYIAISFGLGASADWLPTFFSRTYGFSLGVAGFLSGALVVVGGFCGTFTGGFLGDLCRKYISQPYFFVCGVSVLISAPIIFYVFMLPPPKYATCFLLVVSVTFSWMYVGPCNAILNNSVSANMRGRSNAVSVLLIHLLGDASSPAIVGAISDATGNLLYGLSIVPLSFLIAGLVWCFGWLVVKQNTDGIVHPTEEEKAKLVKEHTQGGLE